VYLNHTVKSVCLSVCHEGMRALLSSKLDSGKLSPVRFVIVTPRKNPSYTVAQLVEALSYMLDSRGLDSRWRHWDVSLT